MSLSMHFSDIYVNNISYINLEILNGEVGEENYFSIKKELLAYVVLLL